MHPLGLVMAFAAFGLVAGLGLFIAGNAAHGLWRSLRSGQLGRSAIMLTHSSLVLFGLVLVLAGGLATYRVIYG